MDALIVGNRPLNKNIIELSRNKLIVAADGGADRLLEYEILPDKVTVSYTHLTLPTKRIV